MSGIEDEPTRLWDRPSPAVHDSTPIPEYLLGWERYVLKGRIGRGGMGEVFEAWDPRLGRFVALKFLGSTDPETLARFEREARSQARVDHPAICKVFEVGSVAGRQYIAMQEIHGVTLDRIAPSLSLREKVNLIREVADAVHAAHRQGLIHRDLKPANILVEHDEDGSYRPFIVDFGLARDQESTGATLSGTMYGTLGYISPEQARGRVDEIDHRTDVFNLGIILYELAADRPAFLFETIFDSLVRLQGEEPPSPRLFNPSIPADIETIVMKALEREPAQRYDSAHAMAEDLRRFLNGEPIVARRSSMLYRVQTRVRKHRGIAAVIAAALVLLAIAGGWVLRERWRADARAQLAQKFGMEIKEIDLVTRVARMLPPDRAVPIRTLILPRMERIRERMRESGSDAAGPGSYALARGSITLGDYREAWNLLEETRRARYDTPEVHYARGQVLGRFYEEALARAANIAEPEIRKAARDEAARRYRQPAVEELRLAANATTDPPELLRAQLALHEGRLEDAIAAARGAASSAPWLYEAVMIEVSALRARARALSEAGKFDEALSELNNASEKLKTAIAVARGDAMIYSEDCSLQNQTLHTLRFQRRLTPADAERAIASCIVASQLDPMMAAPWATRGTVYTVIAEDGLRHGDDPTNQIDEAVLAMRRAISLDPEDSAALAGLGRAKLTQARWGIPRGIDPRPLLESAQQALEKSVNADPRSTANRLSLANVFLTRGEYEHRTGSDSRPSLLKAIEAGRLALTPDPSLFLIHNLLGNTYNMLADRELARGGDPREAIAEATKAFQNAAALNPSSSPVHNNQGNTWLTLADYQAGRNESIDDAATKAIAAYRRAIDLRPDYTLAWINIGYTNRLLALDRVRHNKDPRPALRDARDALDRYEAANPGDIDAGVERARAAIVEGRWLLDQGSDPRPALGEAERAARKALSIDKSAGAAMLVLAERDRWEAEWLSRNGRSAGRRVRSGLETVARVKNADPRNAEAMALEGALLMIEGHEEMRERARALIDNALRSKPSLRPDYDRLREGT